MIYRQLGNTDLNVSTLGFGTMRLPIANIPHPEYRPAIALIRYAIEKGINFFDVGTFYCHHHCEAIFGEAIKDHPQDDIIISGKNSTHQQQDPNWTAQLVHSLSLFHRDRFDIYFLHYLTLEQWKSFYEDQDIIRQIEEARDKGLFRYLGFSSHDGPENVRQLIDSHRFDAVILPYNLIDRTYEATMRYACEAGLGVIAMNPMAGGNLANHDLYPDNLRESHQDLPELALNYVLTQPFIHTALSGMESKEIIDHNVRTVHQSRLTLADVQHIEKILSRERIRVHVPCMSCGYCLPCPQGIDIPAIMRIWNRHAILADGIIFDREYEMLPITAESCIKCDACADKCPHHLPISEIMERAVRRFRDFY